MPHVPTFVAEAYLDSQLERRAQFTIVPNELVRRS